jgi:plastocyanin
MRSSTTPARGLARTRTQLACAVTVLAAAHSAAHADTTQLGPSLYAVDSGVTFDLGNSGSSHYLFSWSDTSGAFTSLQDPTLVLTAGQTYFFRRTSGSHPFVITDDTLPVSGSDGTYQRTTFSQAVIDAATLDPIDDFTADPAPTTDQIAWTPTLADVGTYFYTCSITSHPGMTGRIQIVSANGECSSADLAAPFGALNFFDLAAYLTLFNAGDPAADLAAPFGSLNFFDISVYLTTYNAGCP